ncbi:hypothetical protein O1Q96_14535 [Streptomyces sp. Qhu-G9]|uniref:hypothetical protein n=1 Tax=Streptomyces sp. Qhu-G9 TaxID=3452799 RepID=UPI0022ABC7C5|nr:hypothetical protein [Streptomyces aurantiacus]WAU80876.1 hypothetical protein O1Q96_14535 [Streptomyces aurantiacus]
MHVTQASWKSEIFQAVFGFLPDWAKSAGLGLVVLAVLAYWALKVKRRLAYRRAVRSAQPVHAAARYEQGRGADYLGAYAPRARQDDTTV